MSLSAKLRSAADAAGKGWKSTPKKPQHSTSPPPPLVTTKPAVPGTNTTPTATGPPKPAGASGITQATATATAAAAATLLAGKGTAPDTTVKKSTMETYIRSWVPTRKKAMQIIAGATVATVAVVGLGWYLQNNRNSYLGPTNRTGDTRNSSYGPNRHTSRTQAPNRVHYARDTYPTGHRGLDPTASSYQGHTHPSVSSYQQAPAPIVPTYDGNPGMISSFPTDNLSYQPATAPVGPTFSANTDVTGNLPLAPIIPAYSLPADSANYAPSTGPAAPTFDQNTANTNTFPAPGPPYELPTYSGPIQSTYHPTADMYGRSQSYPPRSNYHPSGPSAGPGYGYPMRSGGGPTYEGMRPQYRRPMMQHQSQPGLIETLGQGVGSVGSKVADGVGGILSGLGGVVGMLGQDADLKTSSTSV